MTTDLERLEHLELRDFRPRPMVQLSEHPVLRSPAPAVDVHNHLGRWHDGDWRVRDVPALIGTLDECNVETVVNLDGCWGDELEANLDRFDRAFPGRLVTFCRVDWNDCRSPGWPERLAASVADSRARGARGIKLWKDIGLRVRDEHGALVFLDDPRLEPLWAAIETAGLPVLVHTADPAAFFEPLDETNERVEELLRHPDWYFGGDEFPPLLRLLGALETAVAAHPGVTFVGAHVGCYAENLDWVQRMLDAYPNFNVDIAARIAELGRQPRRTKRLIDQHPDRVLLGTDVSPPTAAAYASYFRFLATDDEYFPYSDQDPGETGRWRISALDLDDAQYTAVAGGNARGILGSTTPHSGGACSGMTTRRPPTRPASFPYLGFLILAAVIVLAVTTETMPTGLLPDMSASLRVSRPAIGLLVTTYALTVAAVSIPLIRLTRSWPRHLLLTVATAELGLSVILSAAAPSYGFLAATRVLGGLGHAVFWATIGAYPGHAVERRHIARAVAITLGGSTVGFVFGLPLATAIGQSIGWRPTFASVGAALIVAAAAVWRFLPPVTGTAAATHRTRHDPSVVPVALVCLVALISMTGHYAFYTYIAAYAHEVLAIPAASLGALLLLTGLAGAAGLIAASTIFAARPVTGLAVGLSAAAASVALFATAPGDLWLALPGMFGWSMTFGLIPPLLQTHLLNEVSSGFRDAANAIYTATFNVGIGGGALVGALLYGAIGLWALPWVDVAGLVASVAVIAVAGRRMRTPGAPAVACDLASRSR